VQGDPGVPDPTAKLAVARSLPSGHSTRFCESLQYPPVLHCDATMPSDSATRLEFAYGHIGDETEATKNDSIGGMMLRPLEPALRSQFWIGLILRCHE
jgi:hypothetical protein